MKKTIFIICCLMSLLSFGQKTVIENLINQIAQNEIPENYNYYYIVAKSLEEPQIIDSVQNYQIRDLKMLDEYFPQNLIYQEKEEEILDWTTFKIKNTKYVTNEYNNYLTTRPPTNKKVRFVNYRIKKREYDSLSKNRKPHTIIVKKKWFWKKNNLWKNEKFKEELLKAWAINENINMEEKIYFQFSKPVFSKDNKYARVSIFKNKRCRGEGFTAIYKNNNGTWKKMIEYNGLASIVTMSHSRCGDISIRL